MVIELWKIKTLSPFTKTTTCRKLSTMSMRELLEKIRPTWIARASQRLAPAEQVRQTFLSLLERYYNLWEEIIESGQISLLAPMLDEWESALMQTEPGKIQSNLPPIFNQFLALTLDVSQELLNEEESLAVLKEMLPLHAYILEYLYVKETEMHVQQVSDELSKAQGDLEKLEKTKSDFIAVAAHELRTPLTIIEGYASMLKEMVPQLPGGSSPSGELFLKGINGGTRRLREIVDDMIDVSVIDNDMLSLSFQPIWINRLLEVAQHDVSEFIRERHLTLDVKNFPGSTEMTFGDGERLLQAFRNVITNAIKYTPDGGKISVDGRLLPGFVEITVTDTGIGIDPEYHTRIFEKFGRLGDVSLHSTGKTKFKGGGPGLGLPITKGVIEAHGGAIWVESEGYDEVHCPGSTFHILLPIRKTPPDDKSAKLFHPLNETA
jgi:signal transduction histidine kinase